MDQDGNFVIAWNSVGQTVSYFNNVMAQRFDRDGNRIGSELLVNTDITTDEFDAYVAMAADGHFLITWTEEQSGADPYEVEAKVYDAQGNVISRVGDANSVLGQFDVEIGYASTATWDSGDNYVITFDVYDVENALRSQFRSRYGHHFRVERHSIRRRGPCAAGPNYLGDKIMLLSEGVYGIRYSIYDNPNAAPAAKTITTANYVILPIFRVNDTWTAPTASNTIIGEYIVSWPYVQGNNQVGMDADGDITVTYDGNGAVTDTTWSTTDGTNLQYDIDSALWTAQRRDILTTNWLNIVRN